MPEVESEGARIWYTIDGRDDAPAVLLLHSLGTSHALWDQQLPPLVDRFRLIRYDARGHGKSTAPPGEYTIEQLGHDALAVLDAAGVQAAAICGISIGGLTSVWLGENAPKRVSRLVLANTAARIGTRELWSERIAFVRANGIAIAAEQAMSRWFTSDFLETEPALAARFLAIARACPLESYLAACAALRDTDLRRDLHHVTAPTLVVAGSSDLSTTVSDGMWLRDNIPEARLEILDAAHLSNVERPDEFSALLDDFLIR
ncbi:MAG: 3-oxoadipate enol-lactonase [Gemmatimonadaceae bacterium]|nr:3-oxoadipate enol-lactonase [Gemmatimonadaceae bacterium]